MEHMIEPTVLAGALDGSNIAGIGNNTDGGGIAQGIGADGAAITIGQILTDGTVMNGLAGIKNGLRKVGSVVGRHVQHMEGQTLGALMSDAGQFFKLFYQPFMIASNPEVSGSVFFGTAVL